MRFIKKLAVIAVALGAITGDLSAQACGNSNTGGTGGTGTGTGEPDNDDGTSGDPIVVYTGNEYRELDDLKMFGAVGEVPMIWKRWANSRPVAGNFFGNGHSFRHGFQYGFVRRDVDSLFLRLPSGSQYSYNRVSGTLRFEPNAGVGDIIFQISEDVYELQNSFGWRYRFEKVGKLNVFQCIHIEDSKKAKLNLVYNNNGTRLKKVIEPGGRFFEIHYRVYDTTKAFQPRYQLSGNLNSNGYIEIYPNDSREYRYLRLLSADGKYGNIAEVEFYEKDSDVPILGRVFGSSDTINGNEISNVFDGNLNTYYESDTASGTFVGIDLGEGVKKKIHKIRVYPRIDKKDSLKAHHLFHRNATYSPSNLESAGIVVIDRVQASDSRSVQYNYETYTDSNIPDWDYLTLRSVDFEDGTKSEYQYEQVFDGTKPLAVSFNDVRYKLPLSKSKNRYYTGETVNLGQVYQQLSYDTETVLETVGIRYRDNGSPEFHHPNITHGWGGKLQLHMGDGKVRWSEDSYGNRTNFVYGKAFAGYRLSRNFLIDGRPARLAFFRNNGYKIKSTDALGRVTTYENSPFGKPTKITHPDGTVESWTLNDYDKPLTYTDQLGRVTTYIYDANNRVTEISYPDSTAERFEYNSFGQITKKTCRNGGILQYQYNSLGLLTSKTDALGNVTSYAYNALGQAISETDQRGLTTSYTYDSRGNLLSKTYPDGSVESWAYDEYSNKTSYTNQLGNTWNYEYNQYKKLVKTVDPLGRVTQAIFDDNIFFNKPSEVILPSGKKTAYAYDLELNVTETVVGAGTPEASSTSYTYDEVYNLIKETDALGRETNFEYDARNRLTQETDPLSHSTQYQYDAVGNQIKTIRPDGKSLLTSYDSMDRKVSSTDARGFTTRYAYFNDDSLKTITDSRNSVYSYEVDLNSRKTKKTYPDSSFEKWTYNDTATSGNVWLSVRNRDGSTESKTYDNRSREVFCNYSASNTPDVMKTYDVASRLLTAGNANSLVSYSYNEANELLSETQKVPALGDQAYTTVYQRNADSLANKMTYPSGDEINFTYTERNQLASIEANGPPPIVTYAYDLIGNLKSKVIENGTSSQFNYDAHHRLTQIQHKKEGLSFKTISYTLDNLDRRTSRTENGVADTYQYDLDHQLISATYGDGRETTFNYDSVGNRQSVNDSLLGSTSYLTNNLNQYTSVGAETTQHDFNGNLTSKGNFGASYDSRNRVLSLNNSGNTGTFKYDYRNRQVSRTINGVTTFFIWNDWNLIEERDSNGGLLQSYIHGRTVDDLVAKVDQAGAVYYHQDGLGSTVALTNQDGNVVENYSYKVFGEPIITNDLGQTLSSSTKGNRFLYTGREWMSELAIYDYRNRIYSAELGRFLQIDPIRFQAGDVNIYRYVGNSPNDYIDPNGLDLVYGNTSEVFGFHQKVQAGSIGQSFGANRGIESLGSSSQSSSSGSDGSIYPDNDPFTKVVETIETNAIEDKYLEAHLAKDLASPEGDYCLFSNNCRDYSKEKFEELKERLEEFRERYEDDCFK